MDVELDLGKLEAAEQSIDAFINKRARERSEANEIEAMYAASVRRHREERQREHAAAWHAYHVGQAERLERTAAELAAVHRARAAALLSPGAS
jgi:hypothetical protein